MLAFLLIAAIEFDSIVFRENLLRTPYLRVFAGKLGAFIV